MIKNILVTLLVAFFTSLGIVHFLSLMVTLYGVAIGLQAGVAILSWLIATVFFFTNLKTKDNTTC